MARRPTVAAENNFTKGLVTEFTGLNFPENACTDTDNCVFSRIGRVTRRLGIEFEADGTLTSITRTNKAISDFKWVNAGGDGTTEVHVVQVGGTLHFYQTSSATLASPLSDHKLASTIDLSAFVPSGGTLDETAECSFASGNGYLFVFNPKLEPFFCTYVAGVITAEIIVIKIRDFTGVEDGLEDTTRPTTLSDLHKYNLQNQGWTAGAAWFATSSTNFGSVPPFSGSKAFTVAAGITGIAGGQAVTIRGYTVHVGTRLQVLIAGGSVTSYAGSTLTINVTSATRINGSGAITITDWEIEPSNTGYISTWFTAAGNYPSNTDVWWLFKNSSGVFDPATMIDKVTASSGPAPKGHYILTAFIQDRTSISGVPNITTVSTTVRPKTGTWFQGRVWYAGVDASGFTENIYFSQIVEKNNQFGRCYQTNDPTSEDRFDLLPSDGGIVRIQGMGSVHELFPIQNGLLVFASNGVWFITGSQGIGFTASDYTVTKISSVETISGTSFVNIQGYPSWWNEEGIYIVSPSQGGVEVKSLSDETIASFLAEIPLSSKHYVRGDYNPINLTVQWIFRSTEAADVTARYEFNRILNLNIQTGSFFPWTVSGTPKINGIAYIAGIGGITSPQPMFKYLTSSANQFTFSEERNTSYLDWNTTTFDSFFITGYRLKGQGQRKFQSNYVYVYSNNFEDTSYKIQSIWDYANSGNSGRFSTSQLVQINIDDFDSIFKRHKVRGHGLVGQFKIESVTGEPFDIFGWSVWDTQNAHV